MSITSISSFSCLYTRPSNSFHGRQSVYHTFQVVGSRRRHHLKMVRATEQDGGQIKMETSSDGNSDQGGGDGGFPQLFQWLFGSLFLVAIPIWRRIKNVDKTIEKADAVVETVEGIADKIGQVAEDIAEELPDGGRMKEVVLKIEDVAERVEEGARTLDNVLDKISDSIDNLEDAVEEADKLKDQSKDAKTK